MGFSLRSWKPGHLLVGWAAYWVGLVAVKLSPAIRASWRATQLPDNHGTITAGFDNATLHYTVIENGVKTLETGAAVSTMLLWVAGPPLVLWLIWLMMRERPNVKRTLAGRSDEPALTAGSPPAEEWRPRREESIGIEQGRIRTPNP